MKIDSLGDVVLIRKLYLIGETEKEVVVKVGKPRVADENGNYYCPFQIVGLGRDKINYAMGIDAVQAMLLGLSKIGIILYASEEWKEGRLRWIGDEQGDLGFPVPDSFVDLLPPTKFHW